MSKYFVSLFIKSSFFSLVLISTAFAQPKIMLKLDDIGVKNNQCKATPVIEILTSRKIKAGLGVIAANLDSTALNVFTPYLKATDAHGNKLIEIWHHGLTHTNNNPPNNNPEFKGTSLQFQQEHFNKADKLVLERLGVQMHSFGSPYNAADDNTNRVVAANPNYKVFMLSPNKDAETDGVANYNHRVMMEISTGMVNYDSFVADYQKLKGKYPDYMVLQGHPNQWDTDRITEFNKILDFLVAQKCEFVLPYDYYLATHKSKTNK